MSRLLPRLLAASCRWFSISRGTLMAASALLIPSVPVDVLAAIEGQHKIFQVTDGQKAFPLGQRLAIDLGLVKAARHVLVDHFKVPAVDCCELLGYSADLEHEQTVLHPVSRRAEGEFQIADRHFFVAGRSRGRRAEAAVHPPYPG
jgi:hypothetical protein